MNLVKSFPAYDIMEDGNIIHDYDKLAIFNSSDFDGKYVLVLAGSVAGYAAKYNEDTQQAVNDSKAKGETLYWLTPEMLSITSHKRDRRTYRALYVGQKVNFDGNEFTIQAAPNRNFNLV